MGNFPADYISEYWFNDYDEIVFNDIVYTITVEPYNNYYIRQDIGNQKVYLYQENEDQEYDISINQFLSIGDTIDFKYYQKLPSFHGTQINGEPNSFLLVIEDLSVDQDGRVTYMFSDIGFGGQDIVYVAGIGFFRTGQYLGNSRYRNSCHAIEYTPSGVGFSYIYSTICLLDVPDNQDMDENILVYPNPTSSTFQIQSDYPESMIVSVYNLEGKKLYEDNAYFSNSPISCAHYSSGLYFVEIKQGETISRLKLKVE